MDDILKSNTDPIGYGWVIRHLGNKATKEQLQRALLVVLKRNEADQLRIRQIEPLAAAIDTMIQAALDEK